MLRDPHAARRGHDPGERGDVEGGEAVAAGPAGVEKRAVALDRRRQLACLSGEAGDLIDRLALHAQRDHEASDLNRRSVAPHDRLECGRRLGLAQRLAAHKLRNRLDQDAPLAARLMKLPRIFLPSLVNTDSGWNWTP